MPPGNWDQTALIEWLEHFYNGGTDCDVPLIELPKRWEELGAPKGITDLICITDAVLQVPDNVKRNFVEWKTAENAKLFTIVLGSNQPGDMKAVSDRVWCLPDLSLEQDAIQELMAI